MDDYSENQSQIPLHRRIAENLGAQVSAGQLKPGQKLPSERQIARQFRASRATVRTALQHLEQAGVISRRERRSAVVSIRRDLAPYLRIGCCDSRLTTLFNRLSDMQVLPPRSQIQLCDLRQPQALNQLQTQPSMGVDLLMCGFEFLGCVGCPSPDAAFPQALLDENLMFSFSRQVMGETDNCLMIPLTVSPVMLFYNRRLFSERQMEPPRPGRSWSELADMAQNLAYDGRYGLQFRPNFEQLSAIMAGYGAELFGPDGKVAAQSNSHFEAGVRFMNSLLHTRRCSPLLAKADQINLFTRQRCAMAVDTFESFGAYREALQDDLGVTTLPQSPGSHPVMTGLAAVSMGDQKNLQPIRDLLRTLLSHNSQRIISQMGMGLPVRTDLLSMEALQTSGVTADMAQIFLNTLQRSRVPNLPVSAPHRYAVEALFLEMWLGVDGIDSICRRFKEVS